MAATTPQTGVEKTWDAFNRQRDEWIAANPILRWRRERDVAANKFASAVGRNPLAVQHWETGQSSPSRESRRALVSMFNQSGVDGEKILHEFDEWRLRRPVFGK